MKTHEIRFDGMGIGKTPGLGRAESRLKKSNDGDFAICRFMNGIAIYIKTSKGIKFANHKEIKTLNETMQKNAAKKGKLRLIEFT